MQGGQVWAAAVGGKWRKAESPEPRGTEACFCVLRGTVIIMTLFLKNKQTDKKQQQKKQAVFLYIVTLFKGYGLF